MLRLWCFWVGVFGADTGAAFIEYLCCRTVRNFIHVPAQLQAAAEVIAANPGLTRLVLSGVRIADTGAVKIANALAGNTNLHLLSLHGNQVSPDLQPPSRVALLPAVAMSIALSLAEQADHRPWRTRVCAHSAARTRVASPCCVG